MKGLQVGRGLKCLTPGAQRACAAVHAHSRGQQRRATSTMTRVGQRVTVCSGLANSSLCEQGWGHRHAQGLLAAWF